MERKNIYGLKVHISAESKKEIIICVKREIRGCKSNLEHQTKQSEEYLQRAKDLTVRIKSLEKLLKELK